MTSPTSHRLALAATVALLDASTAAPAASTGTHFEPAVQLQGARLQLNGAGTRFRTIFKVYVMALYTTRKVGTPEDLLALAGPKKLQFTALRDLPGTDLGRLFVKGMSENSTREQATRHTLSTPD